MTKIRKTIYVLATLGLTQAAFANVDQYGQDLSYQDSYKQSGCSEIAWKQNVAYYQSKVNEYNARSAKLNEMIMNASVDPSKLNVGDCLGDIETLYKGTLDAMKQIYDTAEGLNASGFESMLGNAFDKISSQIINQVKDQACQAASSAINEGLKKSGITKLQGEITNMSKNPFGYLMNQAGVSGDLSLGNDAVKLDFETIVKNAK